MISAQ